MIVDLGERVRGLEGSSPLESLSSSRSLEWVRSLRPTLGLALLFRLKVVGVSLASSVSELFTFLGVLVVGESGDDCLAWARIGGKRADFAGFGIS